MSPGHWDTPLMASEKRFCVYTLFSRILTWFQNVPSLPKCFSQTKLLQNGWDFFFLICVNYYWDSSLNYCCALCWTPFGRIWEYNCLPTYDQYTQIRNARIKGTQCFKKVTHLTAGAIHIHLKALCQHWAGRNRMIARINESLVLSFESPFLHLEPT